MSEHLPECEYTDPTEVRWPRCICDRLRKAERRARSETARGIYDHLFNKGAAYQWPNVLNTIRDWAENNGLEDPK